MIELVAWLVRRLDLIDQGVLAGESRGEDHTGFGGNFVRKRPAHGNLFAIRRGSVPWNEWKSSVFERGESGGHRHLGGVVQ